LGSLSVHNYYNFFKCTVNAVKREKRCNVQKSLNAFCCQDLTFEGVTIISCADNGSGGCAAGPVFTNVTLEEGQFCLFADVDGDVDADDVTTFLEDFGRDEYFNPCPACVVGDWCVYE
jgi:hypothetical protein